MPSLLPILSYDVTVQDGACDKDNITTTTNTTTDPKNANVVPDAASVVDATKLMNKAAYTVQMALYNGLKTNLQLNAATSLITQNEYTDVVTERSVARECGYPLCSNPLKLTKPPGRGRYHIALREHKVYNLEETRLYCSADCIVDSKRFCAGLQTNREVILKEAELEEIVSCVRGLSTQVSRNGKLVTPADLALHEHTNAGLTAAFENLGSSGDIEGYVPRNYGSLPALESPVREGAEVKSPKLKSAMKNSPRKHQRITWADENKTLPADDSFSFGTEALFDVLPGQNGLDRGAAFEDKGRLEIAQAVAAALSDAASAASAGKVEASEAASSTGLFIVSPGTDLEEVLLAEDDDVDNNKQADHHGQVADIPLLESRDMDSIEELDLGSPWLDVPPTEFKAELSTFGSIWMALDGWASAATLAHMYNRDGDTDEFRNVNNRVEGRSFDEDGSWAEILKTMSSCISRVLPEVVREMAISTPNSVIEQSVDRLLRTMNFSEALPPLSTKQWRMITLLFMDALSTYRLAPLGPQLAKNKDRFQKIIKDSGTSEDEYERYKELLLPLGR